MQSPWENHRCRSDGVKQPSDPSVPIAGGARESACEGKVGLGGFGLSPKDLLDSGVASGISGGLGGSALGGLGE